MCYKILVLQLTTILLASLIDTEASALGDEWIQASEGRQFFFSNVSASWFDAQKICKNKSADLAEMPHMSSTEMISYIGNIVPSYFPFGQDTWLGGFVWEHWSWISTEPIQSDAWKSGQPNEDNGPDVKYCALFDKSGLWDRTCSNRNYFICERQVDREKGMKNVSSNKSHDLPSYVPIYTLIPALAVIFIFIVVTISLIIYIRKLKSVIANKDSGNDDQLQSPPDPKDIIQMQFHPYEGMNQENATSMSKAENALSSPGAGYGMNTHSYGQEALYENVNGNKDPYDDQEAIYEGECGNTYTYADQEPIYEGEIGNTTAPIGNQYYESPTKFKYGH